MRSVLIRAAKIKVFTIFLLLTPLTPSASAFDYIIDSAAIGAAFMTNLGLHEVGHQIVAEEAGAESPRISFFTKKNGAFFFGVSECQNIPKKSKLSHHVAGEWMVDRTFEFARKSYHQKPTTYYKALMFFSCTDFLWYNLYAFYLNTGNNWYDPNGIAENTGFSQEALLALITAKTLLNAYRIYDKEANFMPIIMVDKTNVGLMVRFDF